MKSISTPNIIGIVILLLFATYAIAVVSKENAQYFLDKGNTLFNEHRLTEANLAYGKALEKDPEISLAHYQLARIYFVEGKFQEAEQEITLEIALHEDNKRAFYLSGLIYSFQENFALAEQAFYEFVHAYPDSEAGNNDLAQILFVQGKFQEAEQTLLHILSFYKESFLVAQGLGAVYLELGEFTKAKQYIQSTLDTVLAMDVSTFMKYYPSLNPKYAQDGIATIREGIRYNLALAISGEQGLFNKQQVASKSFAPYFQSVSGEQRQGAVFLAASCEADFEHFSNECFDTICSLATGSSCTACNNVGQCNTGSIQCNGSCSAAAPADDTQPPTISINATPSSPNDKDRVSFSTLASDSSGIAETRIFIDENNDGNYNDNGKTCASSFCAITTGPYLAGQIVKYYATTKDIVGNFASTLTTPRDSFTVTFSPPDTVTLFANPVGSVENETTVTYTAVVDKDVSNTPYWIHIFRDGVVKSSCSEGVECFYSPRDRDITRVFTAKVARDDLSDVIVTSFSISTTWFNLDTTPPTSTIEGPTASSWKNVNFPVGIEDTDNVDTSLELSCYYHVYDNSVGWTKSWETRSCTLSPTITVGEIADCRTQGKNNCAVYAFAIDSAGNIGSSSIRTFSIDYTSPIVGSISPTTYNVDSAKTFTASVSDVHSGIIACQLLVDEIEVGSMTLSNSPCIDCIATKSYTFTDNNPHIIAAICADGADQVGIGQAPVSGEKKFVLQDILSWFVQSVEAAFINPQDFLNITTGPSSQITASPILDSPLPTDHWQRLWFIYSPKSLHLNFDEFIGEDRSERAKQFNNQWGKGQVYNTDDFDGDIREATKEGIDNIGFKSGRLINFPLGGTHIFTIDSDDGVRLTIDGNIVINKAHERGDRTEPIVSDPIALDPGFHDFIIEWYEGGDEAYISFDFGIEEEPPSIIDNTGPNEWYGASDFLFNVDVVDNTALYKILYQIKDHTIGVGGTEISNVTGSGTSWINDLEISSTDWKNLSEGSHTIYVKAIDIYGNCRGCRDIDKQSFTVKKDSIPPTINITNIRRISPLDEIEDLGPPTLSMWLKEGIYEFSVSIEDDGSNVDTSYRIVNIISVLDGRKFSPSLVTYDKFHVSVGPPGSSTNDCVDQANDYVWEYEEELGLCGIFITARDLARNDHMIFRNFKIDYTSPTAK